MRAFTITTRDIDRCPIRSLLPSHYLDDGSCRCVGKCERPTCDGSVLPGAKVCYHGHNQCPTLEPVDVRETVEGTAYEFANQRDRARFLTYNFPHLTPMTITITSDEETGTRRGASYITPDKRMVTCYGPLAHPRLMVWKAIG